MRMRGAASILRTGLRLLALAIAVVAVTPVVADARIIRIEITRVESPTFQGASFGRVGPYEKLVGRAFGEIDPTHPRNAGITDILLAPRNARGLVEYSTDIYILRPIDRFLGNRRVFFEINNRGNSFSLGQFNDAVTGGNDPTTAADAGNGFLMRQGYTIVLSGWEPTVPAGGGRFTMTVPIARNPDGSPIVGPSLEEFVIDNATTLTGPLSYPAATLDKSQATLTVRVRYEDPPVSVPSSNWEYVDAQTIRLLPAGTPFARGTLYWFTYPARDPIVAGLGLAAIRDVGAFLRYSRRDDRGNPNPLAGDVEFVYSFCFSQPCRAMHDFLWLGFNEDEEGRTGRSVFDSMLNWVGGASSIFLNYRFAQPGRTHRQHIGRPYPEYQFPFTNQVMTRGQGSMRKTDGRLRRCLNTGTCPKIFEVNSENDYWSKAISILHTDGDGRDLADPANVRYFLLSNLPHSPGVATTGVGICQQERNPLVANPALRALLVAMDEWVTSRREPPASRVPRQADGALVLSSQAQVGFPSIPGVKYNGRAHTGELLDFGPLFSRGILTVLPPVSLGTPNRILVPKTDSDGHDVAGIRLPDVAVPLATYTGWALRAFPPGADEGCDMAGQRIDFPRTRADRLVAGDPRSSIEERYPTHETYVNAVTQVATSLNRERLLLEEDVQRYIERAASSGVGR